METNFETSDTRYPFHGFYRPLLAELEEIGAERAKEQEPLPQAQPTNADLSNATVIDNPPAVTAAPAPTLSQKEQEFPADSVYDHGYRATMQERVWDKTLQVSPREYRDEAITHYIIDNFGKAMSKQELQAGLAETGLYKPGKRPIGQSILNGKLKK